MRRRLLPAASKSLATGLVLLAFAGLNACGGAELEPIKIVEATVEPNPVPAPTADQPTAFVVKWRVKNRQRYSIRVQVDDAPNNRMVVQEVCVDCDNKLVTMSCTASISARQSNARELTCERDDDPRLAPQPPVRVGAYPWNLHVQESSNPFFGGIDDMRITVEFK